MEALTLTDSLALSILRLRLRLLKYRTAWWAWRQARRVDGRRAMHLLTTLHPRAWDSAVRALLARGVCDFGWLRIEFERRYGQLLAGLAVCEAGALSVPSVRD